MLTLLCHYRVSIRRLERIGFVALSVLLVSEPLVYAADIDVTQPPVPTVSILPTVPPVASGLTVQAIGSETGENVSIEPEGNEGLCQPFLPAAPPARFFHERSGAGEILLGRVGIGRH